MNEEREKILNAAESLYSQKGFYKTTVEELARSLRMSKKTIYKHFPGKKEILHAVVARVKEDIRKQYNQILATNNDPVTKAYYIFQSVSNRSQKLSKQWLSDLKMYEQETWLGIEEFRREFILNTLINLIIEGQKQALIIDAPPILIVNIILSGANGVIQPEFLINTNISVTNAIQTTLDILFRGILTKKGRQILKKLKGNKNEK